MTDELMPMRHEQSLIDALMPFNGALADRLAAIEVPELPSHHPAMDTSYIDDEAVVFDDRTAVVHRLNPSATVVWLMCDGDTSADSMLAELSDAFDRPADDFRVDVTATLRRFWDSGMLAGSSPMIPVEFNIDLPGPLTTPDGLVVLADAGEP
jgi:Coenzyme PQQ synthesis protein D (PqqD)